MNDERDQLGHDDSDARKDLRARLVEAYRSLGLSFPETDEEIAAFEAAYGPFEALSEQEVERLRDAVLERLRRDDESAFPAPDVRLWSGALVPASMPTGVYRKGSGTSKDAGEEAVLDEHRRRLRDEILRRRAAREGGGKA